MKHKLITSLLISFTLFSCNNEITEETKPEVKEEQKLIGANIEGFSESELYSRLEKLEEKLVNEESLEVSKRYSLLMLEAGKKHIEKFPKSINRREAIRKASKAAQGLQQDFEAIRILEIGISEFANDSNIIEEMNVRAFLFDKMDNKKKAREAYDEIIEKFPNHPSTVMHKARLSTLDMNEEELMEWLEKQNAK